MENNVLRRVVLCDECGACPEVVVTEHEVAIGEDENVVRLTHEEWNILVRKIRSGELGAV